MTGQAIDTLATVGSFSVALAVFIWVLFSRLESRIEATDGKIDATRTALNGKIDATRVALDDKIDATRVELRTEIQDVDAKLDDLRKDVALVQQAVAKLDGRVDELSGVVRTTITMRSA
ncbi:MAG: hypothetical protein ACRDHX_12090 [Chloroflexota bacterium]